MEEEEIEENSAVSEEVSDILEVSDPRDAELGRDVMPPSTPTLSALSPAPVILLGSLSLSDRGGWKKSTEYLKIKYKISEEQTNFL